MHNGKVNWDGHSGETAMVQWEVDFSASPTVTKRVEFQIVPGDSAATVAGKLAQEWGAEIDPEYSAEREGASTVVQFCHPVREVVGMRVAAKGFTKRVPANMTEVEVVPGLFVFRSH